MRHALCLAALMALASPAAAEPFHHPFGEWREYNRDWLAACPDTIDEDATDYYGYSCFASTGSQELNDANLPAYKLTLIRNRLDGVVDLAITISPASGEFDPARVMELKLSGETPIVLDLSTNIETRFNTVNQFFLSDPAQVEAVIDMMTDRNAATLSVPLKGEEKPVEVWLSLRGVLASLDFMATHARKVAQY